MGLLGAVCRLPEDHAMRQVAARQITIKSSSSHSWYAQARRIGQEYNIDIGIALSLDWTKEEWANYTKNAIKSYWNRKLKDDARKMTSLYYVDFSLLKRNVPHPVWPKTHIQHLITAAAYRAKMLSGSYILQSNTAQFNQFKVDQTCKLCKEEAEDMPHFLIRCKALKKTRKPFLRKLRQSNYECMNDEELCKLILNGPPDECPKFNQECSKLCHKLHLQRYELLGNVPGRKSKGKKVNKNTDPNACIHCSKIITDTEEALECEKCALWQHITCQRILGIRKYKRIIEGKEDPVQWICKFCKAKPSTKK
jgi:hypothetical protein